jgi:hypothetical protein
MPGTSRGLALRVVFSHAAARLVTDDYCAQSSMLRSNRLRPEGTQQSQWHFRSQRTSQLASG